MAQAPTPSSDSLCAVFGGTGFVGRGVVRALRDAGVEIRSVARGQRATGPPEPGVELVLADITEPVTLPPVLEGVSTLVHCVGIIRERGPTLFERVHAEGTRHLVEAAKAAGVRRIVYISALGTRPDAPARYHTTKWEAEEAIRGSGLEYAIFRPSIVFGPDDEFVNEFAKISRIPPFFPIIGPGTSKFQPVSLDDLAAAITGAVRTPGPLAALYEVGSGDTLSLNEIVYSILRLLGRRRWLIHIPTPVARIQAFFLEHLLPRPPFTREQVRMLGEDNICREPNALPELLGREPVGFEEGIERYLRP